MRAISSRGSERSSRVRREAQPAAATVNGIPPLVHPPYFFFASGLATSRACSMNSRAVRVRFFRVMIPIDAQARSVHRQDLEFRMSSGKSQSGRREDREKASGRKQTHPYLWGGGDYGHARVVEPVGAEGLHCNRPGRAFGRWQYPRRVQQFDRLDPASLCPWMVCTGHDYVGVFEEKFETSRSSASEPSFRAIRRSTLRSCRSRCSASVPVFTR